MAMSNLPVVYRKKFISKSNPDNSYETLIYNDSSISCNCPGWTRRVTPSGVRECKHTMLLTELLKDGTISLDGSTSASSLVSSPVAASLKRNRVDGTNITVAGVRRFKLEGLT